MQLNIEGNMFILMKYTSVSLPLGVSYKWFTILTPSKRGSIRNLQTYAHTEKILPHTLHDITP